MSQLSFFTVLGMGVKSMLTQHDYTISSHQTLDEAFMRGIILVKRRLADERRESTLQESFLPNLTQVAFPKSGFLKNAATRTIETHITWNMDRPENFDCAELHVFTDNSVDSFKHLLDCMQALVSKVTFKDQVILEMMGTQDPRPCSALISLYGPDGLKWANGIGGFLDKNLHQYRKGYALDILYPPKSPYWSSFCFSPGQFHRRRQELFKRLFAMIYEKRILHLSEFHAQYEQIQAEFFSNATAGKASASA
jgi:hypothetical protein